MPEVFDTPAVLDAVDTVLGDAPRPVPLHVPELRGNAWDYVKECIDTGWVSSAGGYVTRFEDDLAAFTGAGRAVATVNGTAALHMACLLAGVTAGDEVLMPSLTFVATANATAYTGAAPHFVEVSDITLGVDAGALADYLERIAEVRDGVCYNKTTGNRIPALIGMHAFGHPFDLDGVMAVCDRFGLALIEDAAESLGSWHHDRHTGTRGRLGVLSFNGNKIMSTGGGGAILTDDADLADRAKHLTTTAKLPHKWAYVHDEVGYNYRLPNINAALGCAQLEYLPALIDAKRELADRYARVFEPIAGVRLLSEPAGCRSNCWLNALVLDPEHADQHGALLAALCDRGVLVRPIWRPMHELAMYAACPRDDLTLTESLAGRVINLPSSAHLSPLDGT